MHVVTQEQLEALAAEVSQPKPGEESRTTSSAVDEMREWLIQHGQEIAWEGEYQDSYKFQLTCCPFNTEHKGVAVFVDPKSRKGFHCFHESFGKKSLASVSPAAAGNRAQQEDVFQADRRQASRTGGGRA